MHFWGPSPYFTYKYITWPDSLVMLVGWERIAKEEAGWGASPPRLRWRRKGSSILVILNLIFLSAIKKDRKQHPLQCFFLFFFVSNGRTRGATCFCSGMAGTRGSSMLGLFFHFSFNFQPWHLGLRINDRQRRSLFFILSATFVTFHKKVLLASLQRFLLLVPCWWSRTSFLIWKSSHEKDPPSSLLNTLNCKLFSVGSS